MDLTTEDITIFLWQMQITLNQGILVNNDIQIAIDEDDIEIFHKAIMELENNSHISIQCSKLAVGQPHGTDDNVQYGKPSLVFSKLIIIRNDSKGKIITPKFFTDKSVEIEMPRSTIESICSMASQASQAYVTYGYDYYLEIFPLYAKLNFWGWCYNGVIAYAH